MERNNLFIKSQKPNNFICLMILVVLCIAQPMYAQLTKTATWEGDNSDLWNDPGNWSTGQVPDENTLAIIPQPSQGSRNPSISNSTVTVGGIQVQDGARLGINGSKVNTGSVANNGVIVATGNVTIQGSGDGDDKMTFASSGNIINANDEEGNVLTLNNVSTFNNYGSIDVMNFNATNVGAFSNNDDVGDPGMINARYNFNVNCQNFIQNGGDITSVNTNVSADYAYVNGVLGGADNLTVTAKKDYVRIGGKGKMATLDGKLVNVFGKMSTVWGQILQGPRYEDITLHKSESSITSGFEMAVEMGWVVGDTVRVESESIRFVFDQLSFFSLDSIKQIHAASKIEFFGTEGSILDLQYNESDSIFYVDDGTIEIHCDSILYDGEDINDLFQPNPIIGPPDLSLKQAYISSASAIDTTGNSGEFKIDIRNHSTAAQVFDYSIASAKGWVQSATGSTVELQPFQYDSLMVQYTIPANADTLPDTVSVSLSVPGEYNETVCSYIIPIVTSQTSVKSPDKKPEQFQLAQNYPNPFNPATSIRFRVVRDGHFSLKVYNVRGEQAAVLLDGDCQSGMHKIVFDASSLPSGIYFYRLEGAEINIVRKMMLLK